MSIYQLGLSLPGEISRSEIKFEQTLPPKPCPGSGSFSFECCEDLAFLFSSKRERNPANQGSRFLAPRFNTDKESQTHTLSGFGKGF